MNRAMYASMAALTLAAGIAGAQVAAAPPLPVKVLGLGSDHDNMLTTK